MNKEFQGYYRVEKDKLTLDLVDKYYRIFKLSFRVYTWSYSEGGFLILIRVDNGQEYHLRVMKYFD